MNSRWMHALRAAGFVGALVLGTTGCDDDNNVLTPPGGGGASNLTVTNATPSDGNATLTANGTFLANIGGFDTADLSETVAGIGHEVYVEWNPSTFAIQRVEHFWGATLNNGTRCLAGVNPCDPAKVSVNVVAQTVTFTSLVLPDVTAGTASSTLNGTLAW